jgi:hypothetical protein
LEDFAGSFGGLQAGFKRQAAFSLTIIIFVYHRSRFKAGGSAKIPATVREASVPWRRFFVVAVL